MGLILFREAFNLGRILNEARFNLVELRAGKGGDGAAFGRFFRAWAFLRGAVGRWRGEREKGREKGLNPNRSLEKASCHFLMTAIRKTALYMLDS